MGSILDVFKPIKDLIDPISKGLKSLFSTASQFPKLMKIMKIAGFGLKWASGVGEVISVLEFLYKTYKNVIKTHKTFFKHIEKHRKAEANIEHNIEHI